ncbi:MAG: ABC transporter substrate-binding protein [Vicinamibacterales bacterium]
MAIEAMRAQGYTVETLAMADTNSTMLALERGDLDFANVQDVTGWAAIEQGAAIVAVIDDSVNPAVLAAKSAIKRCSDLHGKRVAVANLTGGKTVMLNRYIERHCPGTRPALLVVAGEPTRLAGLLSGELDAVVIDRTDLESVESTRPGELSALVVFADEFPGLTISSHFARRELTENYPATVKDWLRALLDARRRLQDPRVLTEELVRRLGMAPAFAHKTAVTYLENRFWDVNGRYTPEIMQQHLDFAVAAAGLKPGMKASDVSDLTFLNAVLEDIGRK